MMSVVETFRIRALQPRHPHTQIWAVFKDCTIPADTARCTLLLPPSCGNAIAPDSVFSFALPMRSLFEPSLSLYSRLSRMGWPRSYAGKMLFVAFLGTHVPLLTLLAYFIISVSPSGDYTLRVGAVALVATLLGTGATLFGLHRLLAPILFTQRSLRAYLADRELPDLPSSFADEAGALMADTNHTLN